ncbi:MAG: rhomboid family intramembrane serine protease [Lentisphaeria bacterium]|nr:rhomboid family intramembrane serine protease [Lentisphaeria bacterium]
MEPTLDDWHVVGDVEERLALPGRSRLMPYLAVLSSARIPYRTEQSRDGTVYLVTPGRWGDRARDELASYERENRNWPGLLHQGMWVPSGGPAPWFGAVVAVSVLLLFFVHLGPASVESRGFAVGALDTARVIEGEWWRTVTSLMLHADASHVLANAVCAAVFGYALSQLVGTGPAWIVILLSGVLGNATEAFAAAEGRAAVGASTATFGALGALGVVQTVRARRRWRLVRVILSQTWLPIAAAGVLLGWLGSGPRADLLGHAFGFAWGMVLGVGVAPLLGRRLHVLWHVCAGLVTAAIVGLAWHVAGLASGAGSPLP